MPNISAGDSVNSRTEHFIGSSSNSSATASSKTPKAELQHFTDILVKELKETRSKIRYDCHEELKSFALQLQQQFQKDFQQMLTARFIQPDSARTFRSKEIDGINGSSEEGSSNDGRGKSSKNPTSSIDLSRPLQGGRRRRSKTSSAGVQRLHKPHFAPTSGAPVTHKSHDISDVKGRKAEIGLRLSHLSSDSECSQPSVCKVHSLPGEVAPLPPPASTPPEPPDLNGRWQDSADEAHGSVRSTHSKVVDSKTQCQADEAAGGPRQGVTFNAAMSKCDLSRAKTLFLENATEQRRRRLSLVCEKARAQGKKKRRKPWLELTAGDLFGMTANELLSSMYFDNFIGAIILLNAFTIGLQTDYLARNRTEDLPVPYIVIEQFFLVIFTAELSLRVYVHRLHFLYDPEKYVNSTILWNWFDSLVVCTQLIEEVLNVVAKSKGIKSQNFRLMRVLRILRLMRVLRVMRVLRLISELRTIVSSIIGSMRSLFWTIVLLLLMMYIVGVYFTQQITTHLVHDIDTSKDDATLAKYFGSLDRTIISLYQAISGGVDWDSLADPLMVAVDPMLGFAFLAYVAFATLALMNVVTGVFVQTALQSAKDEEDKFLSEQIVTLFQIREANDHTLTSRLLSFDEVDDVLQNPATQKEWKAIDVKPAEAKYLFQLLDINQNQTVEFEEFLSGCLRLHGTAKSIDVLTVMQEFRSFSMSMSTLVTDVSDRLDRVQASIEEARAGSVGGIGINGIMASMGGLGKIEAILQKMVPELSRVASDTCETMRLLKRLQRQSGLTDLLRSDTAHLLGLPYDIPLSENEL